ncbi:hypothetical protein SOVF_172770 [Spinacia oleracea]|uniref:F-box/kelch-repeat protein At3g06240-like n=1 Tax=Spinacia oleracea TaxID=3562 RepID=A0A9R0I3K6_SPIOL|nr:F-box/kelch-repeat protein At3g06240-like [Spinacia oleracea]KNA07355.1 hypothetical protein SOVF_172770 [Spinacia oleracea]
MAESSDVSMAESSDVPMELTTDILSRMPVKSLFRFKLVSILLKNLMESQYFSKIYLENSLKNNNCSLIFKINGTLHRSYLDHKNMVLKLNNLVIPRSFQLSPEQTRKLNQQNSAINDGKLVCERIEVAGSCNGLVLIFSGFHHIALCNPAFERKHGSFKILPCINYSGFEINPKTNCRNQRSNFRVFGFGYDGYSQCYKVVCLTQSKAFLYTLKKNNRLWKEIDLPCFESTTTSIINREQVLYIQAYKHGVVTNNHLHWNITEYDDEIKKFAKETILSFDLHKEEWVQVSVPDELNQGCTEKEGLKLKPYIIDFGVLNGSLSLLTHCLSDDKMNELWVMKEYGVKESWTRLCNVPLRSGIPLVYHRGEDEYLLPNSKGLGWYYPKEDRLRKVKFNGCGYTEDFYVSTQVNLCYESFVNPFTQ